MGNELAGRARNALAGFITLIEALTTEVAELELKDKIDHVLMRSGLRDFYLNESKGQLDSRTENLDELVSVASRFVRRDDEETEGMSELTAFLAYASLEAGEGQAQAGEDAGHTEFRELLATNRITFLDRLLQAERSAAPAANEGGKRT